MGSGVTASAIVHLSFLVLVIFFSEVRPFGSVTAEPISVDIVTPDEVKSDPPPAPKPDDLKFFRRCRQAGQFKSRRSATAATTSAGRSAVST